jgi:hypothetical protein
MGAGNMEAEFVVVKGVKLVVFLIEHDFLQQNGDGSLNVVIWGVAVEAAESEIGLNTLPGVTGELT